MRVAISHLLIRETGAGRRCSFVSLAINLPNQDEQGVALDEEGVALDEQGIAFDEEAPA
jgi:hypothetical protein